ncbi:MAG: prolyl oligopeptidase family serine peptidase, partial [Gemmatimonadota bacterium]
RILGVLNSKDRLAYPTQRGRYIYNFWQDSAHPRGIYRRTTAESYATPSPEWEPVLDIDSLAAREGVTWAYAGTDCLPPEYRHCLVSLSRGGGDAAEVREYDAVAKHFVEGGFLVPEAKSSIGWLDENTLLISSDFGPGSLTRSGYPRIVKLWHRGTPLASATTVFEGKESDVAAWAGSVFMQGRMIPIIYNGVTFFHTKIFLVENDQAILLEIPLDADPSFVGDQLVVYLRSRWTVGGHAYPEGALLGIGYRAFRGGSRTFQTIFAPNARTVINSVTTTKSEVLVSLLDNVHSELHRFRYRNGRWSGSRVPAAELGDVGVVGIDPTSDRYYVTYQSFLQPTSLLQVADDGSIHQIRQLPAMFNASGLEVHQFDARSKDGTRVPYFIVHRNGLAMDGNNATLLSAYGGFQISSLPYYSGLTGSSWLEWGGVYVLANIRGGGEFGPSWHRAAQKENRQRAYDDFLAVAEDLIARKITSPAHLGIEGGSNGGLLVGVALTERPDLFGAVVSAVPLLDMRGYTKLQAGASWIDEYGDPDKPEDWAYISRYSPYQNVFPSRKYPPVLFTTTTHDDRVGPVHARKMQAKMASMGYRTYLFENTEGGHGAGVTPEQTALMYAAIYSFLWKELGVGPAALSP